MYWYFVFAIYIYLDAHTEVQLIFVPFHLA